MEIGCWMLVTGRAAFVDGLDDLKGQAHPGNLLESAGLLVLAGPDQFGPGDPHHAGRRIGQAHRRFIINKIWGWR